MRKNIARRPLVAALTLALAASLTACGQSEEPTSLRLLAPGSTVFIDGWDQKAKEGDRALVEQKPASGTNVSMWVIPRDAEYRTEAQGDFKVEVTLDPKRGYLIVNMHGVQVGTDEDECLADNETYVFPVNDEVAKQLANFEPAGTGKKDASNDDCVLVSGSEG